ncbi:conserved hypothetical protein [Echinococcus multilocularis]|uniref:Uncharacterized protein n=1 Tax=Echinococcus multilocularis TaxID=6211 RepID=A0A068Y1E6_ECHMU|nr:conserved hypothetical protein [Echinococcus multilocularis]
MTEVLNLLGTCANNSSLGPTSNPTSPLNTIRKRLKQSPLSRDEIMSILQNLVLEASLVDYMVAHGVISLSSARELMQVDCKNEQKIEKLMDLLDSECDTPQHYSQNAKIVLLTNALRNTGQHALASQLDRGRKIKPAPLAAAKLCDTGYGSDIDSAAGPSSPNLRRRGQLNLWVQVAAIRLSPASCQHFCLPQSRESPLSLSPLSHGKKRPLLSKSPSCCEEETGDAVKDLLETSKGAYFWIDLKGSSISSTEPTNSSPAAAASCVSSKPAPKVSAISRLLSCLCCTVKRRRNSPEIKARNTSGSVDYHLSSFVCPPPSHITSQESPPDNSEIRTREQALRLAKLAILDAKSNEFYTALSSPLSDALVKFLEQTLGVLVLGAQVESHCPNDCLPEGLLQPLSAATAVSIVATTHEALERLHDAVTLTPQEKLPHLPPASSLSSALETIFQQETDFMKKIDLKDICLSVALQADEMRLAASELEE